MLYVISLITFLFIAIKALTPEDQVTAKADLINRLGIDVVTEYKPRTSNVVGSKYNALGEKDSDVDLAPDATGQVSLVLTPAETAEFTLPTGTSVVFEQGLISKTERDGVTYVRIATETKISFLVAVGTNDFEKTIIVTTSA